MTEFTAPHERPQSVALSMTGAVVGALLLCAVTAVVGLRIVEAHRPPPKPLPPVADTTAPPQFLPVAEPTPLSAPPLLTFTPVTSSEAEATNAATPFADAPLVPAASTKVRLSNDIDKDRAIQCLTQAVYYEAGFEPLQGRRAVAQVVLNRMRNTIFPKTVCGVVFQGSELKTGCQFTFTCDGALSRPVNAKAWEEAKTVAMLALNGFVEPSVGLATHYHTKFVVPYWKPTLAKIAQLGAHIFYRWPGGMGEPRSFAAVYVGGEPLTAGAPKSTLPAIVPPILVAGSADHPAAPAPIVMARTPVTVELAAPKTAVVTDIAPVTAPAIPQVRTTFAPQRQVDWFGNQPGMQGRQGGLP